MTQFRIKIEKEKNPSVSSYNWDEVYEQIIENVDVQELVIYINSRRVALVPSSVIKVTEIPKL